MLSGNKIRKFQNAGLIPYMLPYILENVSTRIDPSYLMRRRLTPEESLYETRKNDILGNILTTPFNKESAQYTLEGLGEGMQAVTPEFLREPLAKVGTYLSPLNYLSAISQGSINPKVGEKVVAGWDPRLLLLGRVGEIIYGPKAVRTVGRGVKGAGNLAIDVAGQYGNKTARGRRISKELDKGIKENTKNGRIEVTDNYFNAPDKWYRITERPEKIGIEEQGKNVTTADSPETLGTINGWRTSVLDNPIETGKGVNEGYFVKKPKKINLSLRRVHGRAHGNTSQAAKGQLWQANTAGSNIFPGGVIEGEAPLTVPYGLSRTHFVNTPWEEVPIGGRIGFHTGEMPMSNLGWFLKTPELRYTYEPLIPEKRINFIPNNITILSPTSYRFFTDENTPVGLRDNEPLVARGYVSPEDLTSRTVEKGFVKGNEPTPEIARFAIEEPEHIPGLYLLRNPVQNPALQAAALDYLKEYPWMKKEVSTKIEPGISEDWSYPYDVMVRHGLREPVTTINKYTRQPVVEQPTPQQTFAPYPTRRFSLQPGFSENWDYQLTPEKMSLLEHLKSLMNNPSTKGSVSRVKRTKQLYSKERYRSRQLDEDENRRLGNTGSGITKEEKLLTTGDQRAVSPGRKGNDNITKAVVKDAHEYANRLAIDEFKKLSLSILKSREKLSKLPDKNSPQAKLIELNLKQLERRLVFAVRAHKNEGMSGLTKFIKEWKGE